VPSVAVVWRCGQPTHLTARSGVGGMGPACFVLGALVLRWRSYPMDPQGHNLSDMRRKKGDFERLRKKLGKGDVLELVFFCFNPFHCWLQGEGIVLVKILLGFRKFLALNPPKLFIVYNSRPKILRT
jgi:hypothetical protein